MRDTARHALACVTRFAMPGQRRCVVCGTLHGQDRLCPECSKHLRPRTGGYCPRCGLIYGENSDPVHLCAACRIAPPPWDALGFHGPHHGLLRELVLAFKFRQGLHLAALLRHMLTQTQARMGTPPPQLVIPVPLHRKRLIWRGYNQSLELARPVARTARARLDHRALRRIRHTEPQTRLKPDQRRKNIRGAFAAADSVRGKNVLLVDDVLTTGATLSECAKTLRKAGAVRIDVLVLSVAGKQS